MRKIKKNQIIITALAVLIAIAGYINYTGGLKSDLEVNGQAANEQAADDSANSDVAQNSDEENSDLPGEATFTSTNSAISGIISNAKLNREQVRAANKETLMNIIENASLKDESKKDAISKLTAITDCAEKEVAVELLLEAKGFNDVVVSMVDGKVDVVIGLTEISDTQRAQVEDIVKRKTGVTADKISINICNN